MWNRQKNQFTWKFSKVGGPIINYIIFPLYLFIHKTNVLESVLGEKGEKSQTAVIFFRSTQGIPHRYPPCYHF